MHGMRIHRHNVTAISESNENVTIQTDKANSTTIDMRGFITGGVAIPSGTSLTTITWFVSDDDTTYYALEDGSGNAVTSTVSGGDAIQFPSATQGWPYLRGQGNAAETGAKVVRSA